MANLRQVRISGTGMFVPPDVVTNKDLERMMDTTDEWIQQRSGIKERRFAKPGVGPADLALPAAQSAMAMAGIEAKDLDMIVFATLSPDYYFPGSGVFLQDSLGARTIPAFDIRNQCSGFLYSINLAQNFIATGQYNRVLVVGAEVHSHVIDLTTRGRDVAVLFGDGAGAVVLEATTKPNQGLMGSYLHSEGAHRDYLKIESPSTRHAPHLSQAILDEGLHFPKMEGRYVFKHAVTRLPEVVHEALGAHNLKPDDVDLYLFHQANMRINEAVLKHLNQPVSKSHNNIDRYGNCSAASIPICLDEVVRSGRLKEGDLVCMASFGAGFTWASTLMRW